MCRPKPRRSHHPKILPKSSVAFHEHATAQAATSEESITGGFCPSQGTTTSTASKEEPRRVVETKVRDICPIFPSSAQQKPEAGDLVIALTGEGYVPPKCPPFPPAAHGPQRLAFSAPQNARTNEVDIVSKNSK